jgi:hypothetical protein
MIRPVAAALAVILPFASCVPAACAPVQAAVPFAQVPLTEPTGASHRLAYASILAGAGGIGLSFVLTQKANRRYDAYLLATDPAEVTSLYDETTRLDRWSSTSLLGGEALIVAGLYLRFLRAPSRMLLALAPERCAVSLRF